MEKEKFPVDPKIRVEVVRTLVEIARTKVIDEARNLAAHCDEAGSLRCALADLEKAILEERGIANG